MKLQYRIRVEQREYETHKRYYIEEKGNTDSKWNPIYMINTNGVKGIPRWYYELSSAKQFIDSELKTEIDIDYTIDIIYYPEPVPEPNTTIDIIKQLNIRKTHLEEDLAYYNKPLHIPVSFSNMAHQYYSSIPIRLLELESILQLITATI